MAFGGGTWLTQNKVLPGTYINFVSAPATFVNLSDRGYASIGLSLDWGVSNEIFTVEKGDFQKNSETYFGYDYTHDKMKGLRDLFSNAKTVYCYRLNSGGEKATNGNVVAKYEGTRGNDISYSVEENLDDDSFVVTTYLDNILKDETTIATWEGFENNYIVAINPTLPVDATAKISLTGGTNGTVTGASHQTFLDKSESYRFNVLGYVGTDDVTKQLYAEHTKRMRDEVGVKFQTVLYNYEADYEGVINVVNRVLDSGEDEASIVYFVTGASASVEINASLTNMNYNGSFNLEANYTQTELINGMKKGYFMFHKVDDNIAVLSDINSFVNWSIYKNEDFYRNQVVRIIDQIATDIANLFNKRYLGKTRNNASGRTSLWADIVAHHQELERIEAIQDFNPKELVVEEGADKVSVLITDFVNPVACMEKLYMVVNVK